MTFFQLFQLKFDMIMTQWVLNGIKQTKMVNISFGTLYNRFVLFFRFFLFPDQNHQKGAKYRYCPLHGLLIVLFLGNFWLYEVFQISENLSKENNFHSELDMSFKQTIIWTPFSVVHKSCSEYFPFEIFMKIIVQIIFYLILFLPFRNSLSIRCTRHFSKIFHFRLILMQTRSLCMR